TSRSPAQNRGSSGRGDWGASPPAGSAANASKIRIISVATARRCWAASSSVSPDDPGGRELVIVRSWRIRTGGELWGGVIIRHQRRGIPSGNQEFHGLIRTNP